MKRTISMAALSVSLASASWAQSPPPLAEEYTFETIDPPGSVDTFVRAINARGDIVGRFLDASRIPHGYLLSDGIYTTIDFPGAARTTATGINARGDIVGTHDSHSFLLSEGRFFSIDFPGALRSPANGINARGDIVGDYTAASIRHGFVATRRDQTAIRPAPPHSAAPPFFGFLLPRAISSVSAARRGERVDTTSCRVG